MFLGPISNYFVIVKINDYNILYLHYLVWLIGASYLVISCFQIQDNNKFRQKLLLFLEHTIKYLAYSDLYPEILYHACFDINDSITTSQFVYLFRSDSKTVIYKV